jgi:hypothetical protein
VESGARFANACKLAGIDAEPRELALQVLVRVRDGEHDVA